MAIRYNSRAKEAIVLGSLLDRFIDMFALALLLLAGTIFSPIVLAGEDERVLAGVLILFLGTLAGGLLFLFMPLPGIIPERLKAMILQTRHLIKLMLKTPWRAMVALVLSLLVQGAFIWLNALFGAAIGIQLPLPVWFLVWPLAKLSSTLPISMGGLGVREAALVVLLGRFGVPAADAVGLGLLWQTVLLAGGAFGGIFYLMSNQTPADRNEFTPAPLPPSEHISS
jgi:uncharacterized membrane protein YbhN (UPF0104 family)